MSILTAPAPSPAPATASPPWLVSCEGRELSFATSRAAAEHLVGLAPCGHLPGEPLPFTVRYAGEDPVDYTGYVDDVLRTTGWYGLAPARRLTECHWRELVVQLTADILVGE